MGGGAAGLVVLLSGEGVSDGAGGPRLTSSVCWVPLEGLCPFLLLFLASTPHRRYHDAPREGKLFALEVQLEALGGDSNPQPDGRVCSAGS